MIVVEYLTGDHNYVSSLDEIEVDPLIVAIYPLADLGECTGCIHWNGPRWGCEGGFSCPPTAQFLPDWMDGPIPEWLLDVDGGGVTGYVTNHSNVPF